MTSLPIGVAAAMVGACQDGELAAIILLVATGVASVLTFVAFWIFSRGPR
jgi:hypothetical protein